MTNREIVQQDLAEIYIGNLNTVDADLKFPLSGRYGTRFTWESKQLLFISHEGKVTRPTHGVGNRKVVLEVTGVYENYKESKLFEATVLEEPVNVQVKKIKTVEVTAEVGESAELPPVVIVWDEKEETVTLPVVWDSYELFMAAGETEIAGQVEGTAIPARAVIKFVDNKNSCKEDCEQKKCCEADKCKKQDFSGRTTGNVDKVSSFAPGSVKLINHTVFAKAEERMIQFLKTYDADQLLYNFRCAAGLDTGDAMPMTGWDAPECNLKGHTTGHYLSGIALAFRATGDPELKEKIDYLISVLADCQRELEKRGWHKGFLSAYGEEQFDLLEKYTRYPEIWAPYYTLDKIMSGLYDCYDLAGSHEALEILKGIGDWIFNRLSVLPKAQRDKMWSMYIAGEYGGMIGILVKLYQATGEERYCEAARFFWNEKLFYPMAEGVDTLRDMHSNQHIPQIIGALELYKAKQAGRNKVIAENFWKFVSEDHSYVIGGNGENEMFHQAGHLMDFISEKTAESCSSYNMLRLTSGLFRMDPDAKKMDFYEKVFLNHTMATMSHTYDGGTTYFMPMCPGGQKEFGTDENTCCHGTGMESRFRYTEDIYMKGDNTVYVNLYIPSKLRDEKIYLEQTETEDGRIQFMIRSCRGLTMAFRVPGWAQQWSVCVDDHVYAQKQEDGYIYINRTWTGEEKIEIRTEYKLYAAASPDEPEYVSLMYGPYILAEISDEEQYRVMPNLEQAEVRRKKGMPAVYAEGRRFCPLAVIDQEKFHVYMKKKNVK